MAEEPVSSRELAALHERISGSVTVLRRLVRVPLATKAGSDEVAWTALDIFRSLRAVPGLAAGMGVALLVVAGVVAALAARARRS